MRAIIPIDLALPLRDGEPQISVDGVLRSGGWFLPEEAAQVTQVDSARMDWNRLVRRMPPEHPRKAARDASRLQHMAQAELEELQEDNSDKVTKFEAQQSDATLVLDEALLTDRAELEMSSDALESEGLVIDGKELSAFQLNAAREARLILDQIWEQDRSYALVTFRYPIFERETETWGTVHYEVGQRHVVIRLHNSNSEKLKTAAEHLVKSFLTEAHPKARTLRIKIYYRSLKGVAQSVFYHVPKQYRPYSFSRIRVLEANSYLEAYSGEVEPERGFRWTVRQRRTDIRVAVVFLLLGFSVLFAESPVVFNLDLRLHDLSHWTNGWLGWTVGNVQQMGSALFVAVFLPVIQVFLFWRAAEHQPYINWSVTERS